MRDYYDVTHLIKTLAESTEQTTKLVTGDQEIVIPKQRVEKLLKLFDKNERRRERHNNHLAKIREQNKDDKPKKRNRKVTDKMVVRWIPIHEPIIETTETISVS